MRLHSGRVDGSLIGFHGDGLDGRRGTPSKIAVLPEESLTHIKTATNPCRKVVNWYCIGTDWFHVGATPALLRLAGAAWARDARQRESADHSRKRHISARRNTRRNSRNNGGMREDFELRERVHGVGGLNVTFRHTPKTGRKAPPVGKSALRQPGRFRGNLERFVHSDYSGRAATGVRDENLKARALAGAESSRRNGSGERVSSRPVVSLNFPTPPYNRPRISSLRTRRRTRRIGRAMSDQSYE